MSDTRYPLLDGAAVEEALGISRARRVQLDDVLLPTRLPGGDRVYLARVIEAVAEQRAARRTP
jgi:hypothetical protein